MGSTFTREEFPETKNYTILDYGYCKVWKRADTQKEAMEQYDIMIDC